jgi:hypothetical protein
MMKHSGDAPYQFTYRDDLHVLPARALDYEVNLHGCFASDKREAFGHLYYAMPGCGMLRIDPDLKNQEIIPLPDALRPMNFHSTKLGNIDGAWRLFLPANNNALVAVLTLDGDLDFLLTKPEFDQYQSEDTIFAPTDTVLAGSLLYVADGYGANFITSADVIHRQWTGIFGGKTEDAGEHGRFATAHGLSLHYRDHHHLVIADRPSSRLQVHTLDGEFFASHRLPPGSWPCGIDYLHWDGRWIAVVGSLVDPVRDRPAPIYVVDASTYQILSTIRPKEDLGLEPVQHLHNVIWHIHQGRLFLVCQSWNPGHYFVLEKI